MQKRIFLVALMLLVFCLPMEVFSVPSKVSYQGKLTNNSGVPIHGNTAIQFSLYTADSGGAAIWSENYDGNSGRPIINVVNGHFSVELGTISALSKSEFSHAALYLGIKVGSDSEMTPRISLLSSPFSFQSDNADTVDNLHAASFLRADAASSGSHKLAITVNTGSDWAMQLEQSSSTGYGLEVKTASTGTHPAIKVTGSSGQSLFRVQGNGNIGIGVATATQKLEIDGTIKASGFVDSDGNPIVSVDQIWNRADTSSPAYFVGNDVGIGTSSPANKLTISTEDGNDGIKVIGNTNNNLSSMGALLELESDHDDRGRGVLLSHRNLSADQNVWYMGVPHTGSGFQIGVSNTNAITAVGAMYKAQSKMFITETGDVGIGTTTPQEALDVVGDAVIGEVKLGSDTYNNTYAVFQHKDAADYGFIHDNSGRALINSVAGQPINLRIGNTTKLSVEPTGKVAVGGGSNGELLMLNSEIPWLFETTGSSAYTELLLRPDVNSKYFSIMSQDKTATMLKIYSVNSGAASWIHALKDGGSMYIGPNSKGDARLNVSGNARIDGTLKATTFEGILSGDGSAITNIGADKISSGSLDLARVPTIPNSKLSSTAALDNLGGDVDEVNELFLSKTGEWKQPSQLYSSKIVITEDALKRSDSQSLILDGQLKQMVFKTTGQDNYAAAAPGVAESAFLWMYGGDNTYNQVMHLNNSGELWTKSYGLLHEGFFTRADADTITTNASFGTNGFNMEADGIARFNGVNVFEPAATGTPQSDGFRLRYDENFFATNEDAVIFEKTDFNGLNPDGSVVFGNTGSDGVLETSLVIKGDGKVGIGISNPTETLEVIGTVKATSLSGAITADDIGAGTLAIERLSGNSSGGSDNKFLNEKGNWETVNVTVGMANGEIPMYDGSNLVTSPLKDVGSAIKITDRNLLMSKNDDTSLIVNLINETSMHTGVELRSDGGGITYIDFSNDDVMDYGTRLQFDSSGFEVKGVSKFIVDDGDALFDGMVGIKTRTPAADLHVNGTARIEEDISVKSIEIRGGADLAEKFNTKETDIEPGTVMVIDPSEPGRLKVSTKANDKLVAGVVSGAKDLMPGVVLSDDKTLSDSAHPIALAGRVWVKVSNESGDIQPGDLLTTSSKPGIAMKATSVMRSQGAILGKAMSEVQDGMILVLVSLQ